MNQPCENQCGDYDGDCFTCKHRNLDYPAPGLVEARWRYLVNYKGHGTFYWPWLTSEIILNFASIAAYWTTKSSQSQTAWIQFRRA